MQLLAHITDVEVPLGLILFIAGMATGCAVTYLVQRWTSRGR